MTAAASPVRCGSCGSQHRGSRGTMHSPYIPFGFRRSKKGDEYLNECANAFHLTVAAAVREALGLE